MTKRIKKAFGVALRDTRKKRKLSQLEVSSTSGIDRAYVSEIENGEKNPSIVTLVRLADAMEVSPVEIVKRMAEELE